MAKVAITGITGLVGGHVADALEKAGHVVVGVSRQATSKPTGRLIHMVSDLTDPQALTSALEGCDIIFHFADRADRKSYTDENVDTAARMLAALRKAAAVTGVDRIVAASSVYAEKVTQPDDRYGRSKLAMEAVGMAETLGGHVLILRLPPLHGPKAKGAVRHIERAVTKGWPLPFGLATAPRRFLSLDALADLCERLIRLKDETFASAAGQIWYPSSAHQDSLLALTKSVGHRHPWLLPVPGIDRLISGRVSLGQLESERTALLAATGWQALD